MNKIAVKAFIRMGDSMLLLKQKTNKYGFSFWELPGGKMEIGESPDEAVLREINEETKISVKNLSKMTEFLVRDWMEVIYICDYNAGEVILNPEEHQEYRWLEVKNAKKLSDSENNSQLSKEISIFEEKIKI